MHKQALQWIFVNTFDWSILVLFWLFCLKVTIVRFFGGRPAARKDNLLFPQANDPKLAGVSLRCTAVTSCTDLYCSLFSVGNCLFIAACISPCFSVRIYMRQRRDVLHNTTAAWMAVLYRDTMAGCWDLLFSPHPPPLWHQRQSDLTAMYIEFCAFFLFCHTPVSAILIFHLIEVIICV